MHRASFGLLHHAFVNEDLEILHRQTTLNQRSSALIQTKTRLILALGPKSAAFTCKPRRRLHTVCCKRLSSLELRGQKVTDCILKRHSDTHAPHALLHSVTKGPPPSPLNDWRHLLPPLVSEQQIRLPPSSRSRRSSVRLNSPSAHQTLHGNDTQRCSYNAKNTSMGRSVREQSS